MSRKAREIKNLAPYIPFETFRSFIETLKTTVVPPVIDNSILPRMSGSLRSQLLSALRFLGLVDGSGTVISKLNNLVSTYQTENWEGAIGTIIGEAYIEIVDGLDLDVGTSSQLEAAFRNKGNVDGQMLDKAVRFYLAALKESKLTFSPHFTTRKPKVRGFGKKVKNGRSQDEQNEEPDDRLEDIPPIKGTARFRLPIPGKNDGIVQVPDDIDQDDWEMLRIQLDAYVARLIKQKAKSS